MDAVTVLVTGCGSPGISGTIFSLKNNFDGRMIKVIGTDMNPDNVGRYFCEKFYQIHRPSEEYIRDLSKICDTEKVDIIIPQNTLELKTLSKYKYFLPAKVCISPSSSLIDSNDKFKLISIAKSLGIPVPKTYEVSSKSELISRSTALGWPEKKVVVKPKISSGSRGLAIIDEMIEPRVNFLNSKPGSPDMNMEMLSLILGEEFDSMMVMEYLPGPEYTVDVLRDIIAIPRRRTAIKNGITFDGITENIEELAANSLKLGTNIGLDYAYGFQYKINESGEYAIIECNPRVQGTMVLSTISGCNIIYGAVKLALGEKIPRFNPRWGTRLMRYWGSVGIHPNTSVQFV